ncbi:MAG: phage tail tube protein, partial [Arenimonas sp.]
MQSALGANKTISAIAVGATATVTATHDFSAGDYVVFTVAGMYQLNGRVFRVLSVSTTVSFVIEGTGGASLDTTGYSAFTSGTVNKITFGTSITTATTMSASGGDFDFIDTTTIHDQVKTQIPGSANPLNYTFDNLWDASESGQVAMKTPSDAQAQRAFKFTFG